MEYSLFYIYRDKYSILGGSEYSSNGVEMDESGFHRYQEDMTSHSWLLSGEFENENTFDRFSLHCIWE